MKGKTRFLWNKDCTASVSSAKIRSIAIYDHSHLKDHAQWAAGFNVMGWYNEKESFNFGTFETLQTAQAFVMKLHDEIARD